MADADDRLLLSPYMMAREMSMLAGMDGEPSILVGLYDGTVWWTCQNHAVQLPAHTVADRKKCINDFSRAICAPAVLAWKNREGRDRAPAPESSAAWAVNLDGGATRRRLDAEWVARQSEMGLAENG